MIKSFKGEWAQALFNGISPKGMPKTILSAARRKLEYVDAAGSLLDLERPPGNKLHPLLQDRAGRHAIWINAKYRVCFIWKDGDAYDVEIIDYH